jgi:hypothetical protein
MGRKIAVGCVMAVSVLGFGAGSAAAQVFGTFTWQMQPYCNRVTLTLTSVTGNFTLDGSDDLCGGAKKASASGIGVFNPDGTVGLNFTIVTAPSGRAVHVAASVSPANGQGTWSDDSGNSGTFAFFGNTAGLPTRPGPQVAFRVQDLTATLAVTGATTAINTWPVDPTTNIGGGTYAAATGSYTVPAAGLYLVAASVRWQAFPVVAGYRCVFVRVDGEQRGTSCEPTSGVTFMIQPISTVLNLQAGDVVTIAALQSSGGAGTVGASSGSGSFFTVTRLD